MPKIRPFALREIVEDHYRNRLTGKLADPERLEAVYSSRFWQQPHHFKVHDFCNTAAHALHAPIAQISLITANSQFVVASYGKGVEDGIHEELDFSVCQHTVGIAETINVANLREYPVLCDLKAVTEGGIVAYLGVPLVTKDENVIGAFCVADKEEREWTEGDVTMLTQLAWALVAMHEYGETTTD